VRSVRCSPDSPNPFVPIIMVTGRAERTFVMQARDAGVTEFVSKPVSAAKLLQRVGIVLTAPRVFIKSATYTGPDRRRRRDPDYAGPLRRASDGVLDI
jgi:two-component system chemotaxis response regulator CheY